MDVIVTVTKISDKEFSIKVNQEPVDLTGLGPNVDIFWTVQPDPWMFTTNNGGVSTGIDIKNAPPGQFKDKGGKDNAGNPSRKAHNWERKNVDYQTYRYTINVTDGTTTLSWDPSIVNR
jgi:hypothetical protein